MRIARTQPRVMRKKRTKGMPRNKIDYLFNYTVMKARAAGDPRLATLLRAAPHQREQVLRSMGILTETDVTREFPA